MNLRDLSSEIFSKGSTGRLANDLAQMKIRANFDGVDLRAFSQDRVVKFKTIKQ